MLVMVEAIASRAASILAIFAELQQSRKDAFAARVKLSNMATNDHIKELCETYAWVAADSDNIKFNDEIIESTTDSWEAEIAELSSKVLGTLNSKDKKIVEYLILPFLSKSNLNSSINKRWTN